MKAKLIKTDSNNFVLETNNGFLSGTLEPSSFEYKLSLKNCQAIERGYDLDELAKTEYPIGEVWNDEEALIRELAFKKGFQKALEILGDKKFSEENMLKAFITGVFTEETSDHDFEFTELMKDLQQTEWDVEIEMEYYDPLPPTRQTSLRPKLDADGCLILKRK